MVLPIVDGNTFEESEESMCLTSYSDEWLNSNNFGPRTFSYSRNKAHVYIAQASAPIVSSSLSTHANTSSHKNAAPEVVVPAYLLFFRKPSTIGCPSSHDSFLSDSNLSVANLCSSPPPKSSSFPCPSPIAPRSPWCLARNGGAAASASLSLRTMPAARINASFDMPRGNAAGRGAGCPLAAKRTAWVAMGEGRAEILIRVCTLSVHM